MKTNVLETPRGGGLKRKKSQTLKIHIHPLVGIINICFSRLEILQFCIRPLVDILEAMRAQRSAFSGSSTRQCLFASPPIPASPGQDRTAFLLQKGGDERSIDSFRRIQHSPTPTLTANPQVAILITILN